MNKKRIEELVTFFYNSDSTEGVPFRIALVSGMSGQDLTPNGLRLLLTYLSRGEITQAGAENLLRLLELVEDE